MKQNATLVFEALPYRMPGRT